jgi:uncharacterized protein YneF (UPF0154 family)
MFWAWTTVAILVFLAVGGYLSLKGFAGGMSDSPQANEASGRQFIWGLGFCAAALAIFVLQMVVWFRS